MTKMTYGEQLKHPNWQRKRLEKLEAANWTCACCGAKEDTLHVHHRRYVKGQMVWEYEDQDLEVLCENCHSLAHNVTAVLEWMLTHGDAIGSPRAAFGLIGGWLAYDGLLHEESEQQARALTPAAYDLGIVAKALLFYEGRDIAAFLENTPRAIKDPMPAALLEVIERFKKQGE